MNPIHISTSKRIFDIFASILILILFSPVIFLILLFFIIEQIFVPSSRGPLFYKETRISQGKPFVFYKFRAFKIKAINDARAKGSVVHTKELEKDKNNLTTTGIIMRQIYMDELPQIYSVLIGDMSLVGPRPTNTANYEHDIATGLQSRKILKAGLTGVFQAHKNKKFGLNQEKVDMEYAEFCKTSGGLKIILRDTSILIQTLFAVFRAEGL